MTTATMSQTSKATPVLVSISDSVMILDRQKKMDVCYVLSTIDNMQAGVGCSFTRGLRSKTSCFLILGAPALTPGLQKIREYVNFSEIQFSAVRQAEWTLRSCSSCTQIKCTCQVLFYELEFKADVVKISAALNTMLRTTLILSTWKALYQGQGLSFLHIMQDRLFITNAYRTSLRISISLGFSVFPVFPVIFQDFFKI